MADIFEIPVSKENAAFSIRTELDGVVFILRFAWNDRRERWVLSVFDANQSPIVVGVVMNINSDLLGRFKDQELPEGMLMLYDTSEKDIECGRDDFGNRAKLLYQAGV